jgi:hypothetical protein
MNAVKPHPEPPVPPPADGPSRAPTAQPLAMTAQLPVAHGDDSQPDDDLRGKQKFWESEGVPAWLISLVLHTALLILLMLWQLAPGRNSFSITLSPTQSSDVRSQAFDAIVIPQEPVEDSSLADQATPVALPDTSEAIAEQVIAAATLESPLDMHDGVGSKELVAMLSATTASPDATSLRLPASSFALPTGGMAPRNPSTRADLGAMYGATPESENAVEMALQWLAAHQQRNGSWSFDLTIDPCRGRCSHSRAAGDNSTPSTAATGLALLAFLGAGYTHREGKYTEEVRRGIYYLRDEARPTQSGLDLQAGSMYGHGIATLALTEVLAIDRYLGQEDAEIRELVEGVVHFTVVAQHAKGGWRYVPGSPGDMTVSGWQILSLVSARYSNIPLRTTTLPDAKEFVLSLAVPDSYDFGYISRRREPTPTAIGLCMLMYLGQSPHYTPYTMALDKMARNGPKGTDVYHDYYATMALHNARHPSWDDWHRPLRDHLVRTQAVAGHERGSWHFKDVHGDAGGRLYTTAMAALILEVYYRHLPLYQERSEFPL